MADKMWLVMPPKDHVSKKFAAWLRSKGATDETGKKIRATRSDKGTKRKKG